MKGLQLLLQSFGIKIEPSQIEDAFARGKDALPKIAAAFDEISAAQKRIESKIDTLLSATDSAQKSMEAKLDSIFAATDDSFDSIAHLNGGMHGRN